MEKKKIIIEETVECPECGSSRLTTDRERGEIFCEDCGLVVIENLIDYGPEWRAFDKEQQEKRERVGPPTTPTLSDKGLSTKIGKDRDYQGKLLPRETQFKMYRLRKWHERLVGRGSRGANLAIALSEIAKISSGSGLSRDIRETASIIYRKAVAKNLVRGRTIQEVVAAALYAACRQCRVPRTLDEIAEASGTSRKKIGRAYRFLCRELGLKIAPTLPVDYISRFCGGLRLSQQVAQKAIEMLEDLAKKDSSPGKGPSGMAAAVVYIASILCGEKRTQQEIAGVAGVTEVTIRKRYKELIQQLDIDEIELGVSVGSPVPHKKESII